MRNAAVLFALSMCAARFAPAQATASVHVYVSNEASHDVSVIDPMTNSVVATIPVGARARGIQSSPDGKRIYVATSDSSLSTTGKGDGIAVIDVASRKMVRRMSA